MQAPNWEAQNDDGNSPLHFAARNAEVPAGIPILIAVGAELEARNNGGNTPLHMAAWHNENLAVIEALLKSGANPNVRLSDGRTPLHHAAMNNENPAVTEALLRAGANPVAQSSGGGTPLDYAVEHNDNSAVAQALTNAGSARTRQKAKSGSGWLEAAIGIAGGTAIAAAGGGSEEALAAGTVFAEGVISGQTPSGSTTSVPGVGPTGNAGAGTGSGQCEIPGYPRPANVQNLGLSWCPATVNFQARVFALQAAGAKCAIVTGSSSTPEQIQARQQEIQTVCGQLAALGVPNCQCPRFGVSGGPGNSDFSGSIDQENKRREQQAKQQEEARQAARREIRRIEAKNAEVLNSNCSCISIKDDGEYVCMDGFVSEKPLCDIRR